MLEEWSDYLGNILDPFIHITPTEQELRVQTTGLNIEDKRKKYRDMAVKNLKEYALAMYGTDNKNNPTEDEIQQEMRALAKKAKDNLDDNTQVKDFIRTPDGKLIQPSGNDTMIGFQPGGALDNYFNKNFQLTTENNTILKNLTKVTNDLLQKQIDILQSSNRYLADMKNNVGNATNVISAPKITSNNYGGLGSLRTLQGVT